MADDMTEAAYYSNSTGITSLRWPPAAAFARQLRLDCSSNSTRGCFYPGCRRGVKPGNSEGLGSLACLAIDGLKGAVPPDETTVRFSYSEKRARGLRGALEDRGFMV